MPGGGSICLPCIEDLIATKRFAARPKDAEDVRLSATIVDDAMSALTGTLSSELLEEVGRQAQRQLSANEFAAYVQAPMGAEEREEILSMIRWFTRRYPTAAQRLAYARRAYRRAAWRMPGS